MRIRRNLPRCLLGLVLVYAGSGLAQQSVQESGAEPQVTSSRQLTDYLLGPDDEIVILAVDAEEIANRPHRVSTGGDLNLPMVGRIHVAGMTLQELQNELSDRLKTYIRRPDISVTVTQYRSQPVTVIGAVNKPGMVQLEGRKTLVEVLTLAGGLQSDASWRITITRPKESGPIPLPSAFPDASAHHSIAEINYGSIVEEPNPQLNIQILPHDIISVPRAKMVYAIGQVRRPGAFVLNNRNAVSVLQLLTMAEGPTGTAAKKDAKIIRPKPGSERLEVAVNLQKILDGKEKDLLLQPEDILFVPDSEVKGALRRTLETAIQMTTGLAIYRRY
jgi:polysaccharide export outer membrane protein